MSNPEEEVPKPEEKASTSEWLDSEYIQKALREGLGDPELVIVGCEISPAALKGENYASVAYKCKATDGLGRKHLTVIKCLPSNVIRQMFANKAQIFRKEIDMYNVVFPDYNDMLCERGMSMFWPRYYYSTIDGERDTIVLEDASPHGYVMRERRKGLNSDHLEMVLAALARFHACSVAMKLRDPEAFQRKVVDLFPDLLYAKGEAGMEKWLIVCMESAANTIRDWDGDKYKRISDKVLEWRSTILDSILELLKPKKGALLNHGDFWMNNMLFRYATKEEAESGSGKPVQVMLLDFQVARYCSPASDLSYLMVTSVDTDTRKKHWKRLLEHAYLANFWRDLESLGHKNDIEDGLYTLKWLESQMTDHRIFTFFNAISVLKVVTAATEDAPDLDTFTEEDIKKENIKDPFENLNKDIMYQTRCRSIVDELDETGLFD